MNALQDQIHVLAKADPRYPDLCLQMETAKQERERASETSSFIEKRSDIWLLWLDIYFGAILRLYNDCKKEDLKESCIVLKDLFKIQALADKTFVENSKLMEKYKSLYT